MKMSWTLCGPITTVCLAPLLFSSAVFAQERMLEEVVVTAQKREESLQDVPVAVTAIGGEEIEALGIFDSKGLERVSPSLTVSEGANKQNTAFRIRGVGTNVYSIGIEPSVAVIIDDVSLVQPGQAMANLVDIQQIEILRGPQSTLFGKNASAGLINIVTKPASDVFEGFIEAGVSTDDEKKINGSISGPITDSMRYRVTGYYSDYEGYATNLAYDSDINGSKDKGLRAKFEWDITDTFFISLIGFYSESTDSCCGLSFRELDPQASFLGLVPVSESQQGITPSETNTDIIWNVEPEGKMEDSGFSLKANWDIGEHSLVSITALDRWKYQDAADNDGSATPILIYEDGIASSSDTKTDFVSQELRLVSPIGEHLDYMLGLYYADAKTRRSFERGPIVNSDWYAEAGTKSLAIFGQATWKFTDATQLTLGGRYNDEEISVDFDNYLKEESYSSKASDDVWLGKLSLQHFIGDATMLFATASTGYKGQAYDISSDFDQSTADNPVAPEESKSIEAGVKTTLFEQRLQLNAVAFYALYDDYQAQNLVVDGEGPLLRSKVDNVGELTTSGIELDAVALIGNNFTLSGGLAYINAVIGDFPNAPCYEGQVEGCTEISPGQFTQDIDGESLNNSPKWKLTLGGEYGVPLTSMPFDGFVTFSYRWQDEVNFDLKQDPKTVQDSYGIFNLSAGIVQSADQRYRLTFFVNNVFDQDYTSHIENFSGAYLGSTAIVQLLPRDAQRYGGVRFKYSF